MGFKVKLAVLKGPPKFPRLSFRDSTHDTYFLFVSINTFILPVNVLIVKSIYLSSFLACCIRNVLTSQLSQKKIGVSLIQKLISTFIGVVIKSED